MDQISSFWITMFVVIGIYALICGGFGDYVSNQKGRSGWEGFLFGLLLGPIGVVAAACLPNVREPQKLDEPGRPVNLLGDPDDVGDPEELSRWLKRGK